MPISQLSVEVRDNVVRLTGGLDIATVDAFEERFEDVAEAGGDVTLDLSELTFLDSSGIGSFVRLGRLLDGRRLIVRGAAGHVRATLVIAGIEGHAGIEFEPPPA